MDRRKRDEPVPSGRDSAEAYARYLATPDGRLRCELFWRNLHRHIGPPAAIGRVRRALDAGGGTGELATRLAQAGFDTTLLDVSSDMLRVAGEAHTSAPLRLIEGDFAKAPRGHFDLVAAHLAIEYAPEPREAVGRVVAAVRRGGLVSIAFRSRPGAVLARAMAGDYDEAMTTLGAFEFTAAGLCGASGSLIRAATMRRWLGELGVRVIDHRGVRVVPTDVPTDPAAYAARLALEERLGGLPPYRAVARYIHIVARRE